MRKTVACVIPARLESSRLPRKLLLCETGLPLIRHTVDAALKCGAVDEVFVVTDSDAVESAVGQRCSVLRTGPAACGTDRIASASYRIGHDIVVNLQGDEPEISADHLAEAVDSYQRFPSCDVATLATKMPSIGHSDEKPIVKVVATGDNLAVDFWRATSWRMGDLKHVGVYVYSASFLRWFARLPPSERELASSLEQLRAVDAHCRIRVSVIHHPYDGIDTRADYDAFVARWKAGNLA